jgi:coenzyme F420 biosynthesis associated uncharacterized protein
MPEAEGAFVDWSIAGSVAGAVARGEPADAWAGDGERAAAICDEALERVLDYTGLVPESEIPRAEVIGRGEWIAANVATMRDLAQPLEARAAGELQLPWPLGGVVRGALGAAAGAEAGVAIGYAARRVLGQYQVSLTAEPSPPRMLLVGSNLSQVTAELRAERDGFLRWVAIHEQTHSVQFAAVPWLRDHLAGLLARLIQSASAGVDLGALAGAARRLVAADPRKALGEAMRGELARAVAGPEQAALLDELQSTMAVVEGYAEHVMDAAAADDPDLARMRAGIDERRARRPGLADVIARALGLGMKLRQYELGKRFGDSVAAQGGIEAFNRVWESPGALPTIGELDAPERWLERVGSAVSPDPA